MMKALILATIGLLGVGSTSVAPVREAPYKRAVAFSADYSKVLYEDVIVTDQGFYYKRYQYSIASGESETEAHIDALRPLRPEMESRITLSFSSASPALDRVLIMSGSNYNYYLLSADGKEKVIATPDGYAPTGSRWVPNGEMFILSRRKEGDNNQVIIDTYSKNGTKKDSIELPTGGWWIGQIIDADQLLIGKTTENVFELHKFNLKTQKLVEFAKNLPNSGSLRCIGTSAILCSETRLDGNKYVTDIKEITLKNGAVRKFTTIDSYDVFINPVSKRLVGQKFNTGIEGYLPEWFDATTYLSNEVVAQYLPGASNATANGTQLGVKFSAARGSEYGQSAANTDGYTWSIYLENTTTMTKEIEYSLSKSNDDYWFHGPLSLAAGEKREVVLYIPHADSPDKSSDAVVLLREKSTYTGTWSLLGNNVDWNYWHDGRIIRFYIRNRAPVDTKVEATFDFQSIKGSGTSYKELSSTMSGSVSQDSVHRISRSMDIKGKPPITVKEVKIIRSGG